MINPTTHAITEFPVPTPTADPIGITAGPDGNLWFTEFGSRQGRPYLDRRLRSSRKVALSAGSGPRFITAAPDGDLYVTENTGRGTLLEPPRQAP